MGSDESKPKTDAALGLEAAELSAADLQKERLEFALVLLKNFERKNEDAVKLRAEVEILLEQLNSVGPADQDVEAKARLDGLLRSIEDIVKKIADLKRRINEGETSLETEPALSVESKATVSETGEPNAEQAALIMRIENLQKAHVELLDSGEMAMTEDRWAEIDNRLREIHAAIVGGVFDLQSLTTEMDGLEKEIAPGGNREKIKKEIGPDIRDRLETLMRGHGAILPRAVALRWEISDEWEQVNQEILLIQRILDLPDSQIDSAAVKNKLDNAEKDEKFLQARLESLETKIKMTEKFAENLSLDETFLVNLPKGDLHARNKNLTERLRKLKEDLPRLPVHGADSLLFDLGIEIAALGDDILAAVNQKSVPPLSVVEPGTAAIHDFSDEKLPAVAPRPLEDLVHDQITAITDEVPVADSDIISAEPDRPAPPRRKKKDNNPLKVIAATLGGAAVMGVAARRHIAEHIPEIREFVDRGAEGAMKLFGIELKKSAPESEKKVPERVLEIYTLGVGRHADSLTGAIERMAERHQVLAAMSPEDFRHWRDHELAERMGIIIAPDAVYEPFAVHAGAQIILTADETGSPHLKLMGGEKQITVHGRYRKLTFKDGKSAVSEDQTLVIDLFQKYGISIGPAESAMEDMMSVDLTAGHVADIAAAWKNYASAVLAAGNGAGERVREAGERVAELLSPPPLSFEVSYDTGEEQEGELPETAWMQIARERLEEFLAQGKISPDQALALCPLEKSGRFVTFPEGYGAIKLRLQNQDYFVSATGFIFKENADRRLTVCETDADGKTGECIPVRPVLEGKEIVFYDAGDHAPMQEPTPAQEAAIRRLASIPPRTPRMTPGERVVLRAPLEAN